MWKKANKNKKRQSVLSDYESDEEDAPCLVCPGRFTKSLPNEGWIQCCKCKKWAHEKCAGCDENDESYECNKCNYVN